MNIDIHGFYCVNLKFYLCSPRPKPKPAPRRTPIKTPQPQESDEPWVESNSTTMASNPMPTGLSEPFDFYIDSVRFIPDNSSMIKVNSY